MKAVTETLGAARSNVAERVKEERAKRGSQIRQGDLELAAEIRRLVDARPTYGYRRVAVRTGELLAQVSDPVASFTADGAYDQDRVYEAVAERHPDAAAIVPPRSTATLSASAGTAPTRRDQHIREIVEHGRMGWQKSSGYLFVRKSRRRSADTNA
jgi:hypothetical protein